MKQFYQTPSMLYEESVLKFINSHRLHTMGPCNMFYKSLTGKYICADERTAFISGVKGSQQIVNKTDNELEWSKYSEQYKKNDELALYQSQPILKIEESIDIKRQHATMLSLKKGVMDNNGNPAGVFGTVFYIEEIAFWELSKSLDFINTSLRISPKSPVTEVLTQAQPQTVREQLTEREKDCAHYLCRGMSAREIAACLNLSKRTVEFYLANMKDKLLARSKSELIMKLLDNNLLLQ